MGLPPARVMAAALRVILGRAGGCPNFLRAYWTRPKKAGQFPPR